MRREGGSVSGDGKYRTKREPTISWFGDTLEEKAKNPGPLMGVLVFFEAVAFPLVLQTLEDVKN